VTDSERTVLKNWENTRIRCESGTGHPSAIHCSSAFCRRCHQQRAF